MPMTAQQILAAARELPPEEQDWIALELSASSCQLTAEESKSLDAAWSDEIKHRIEEIDSSAVQLVPHDEAMRRFDEHIAAKKRA
jgi:hypothetical protein